MSRQIEIRKVQPGVVWVILPPGRYHQERVEVRQVTDLAAELDVTGQTINRWARGDRIPRTVQLALRALVFGEVLHWRWDGWCVDAEGRFWAPNGPGSRRGFMPTEIEAWQYVFDTNRMLWQQLQDVGAAPGAMEPPSDRRAAWLSRPDSHPFVAAG